MHNAHTSGHVNISSQHKEVVHEALSMRDYGKLAVVGKEGVFFFINTAIDTLPLLQPVTFHPR